MFERVLNTSLTQQKQPSGMFNKKRSSSKFRKIYRKTTLVPESLFQKSCRPKAYNFIEKATLAQVFSCEFCKISRNTSFTEHLRVTASGTRKTCKTSLGLTISLFLTLKIFYSLFWCLPGTDFSDINNGW